jgi:thiol-disulfide isomerase/thioredoxin
MTQMRTEPAGQAALDRANTLEKEGNRGDALAAAYQAIEADPGLRAAHEWLVGYVSRWAVAVFQQKPAEGPARLKALEPQLAAAVKAIEEKYDVWEQRFPDSLGLLYGLAGFLHSRKSPRTRSYLLKLAEREALDGRIFAMLAGDAYIAGDSLAFADYMQKAMKAEPDNARYAMIHASNVAPPDREAAMLDVVKRFPKTEASAYLLRELADDADSDSKRIQYLEEAQAEYSAGNAAAASGVEALFETYLRVNPAKAVVLAQEIQGTGAAKEWSGRVELAQTFVEVSRKLAVGQGGEALALVGKLQPKPRSASAAMLERVKARVMVEAGKPQAGFDALLILQAAAPEEETRLLMEKIGKQLRKTPQEVRSDIRATLYSTARPAPSFELHEHASNATVSLAQLRGKATLLTFWFPGCGPCRREFPHFEAVMRRIPNREGVAYVAVNTRPEEDHLVPQLMEKLGYTFTPLKGNEDVKGKETGYDVYAVPSNFLIDRSGKILYSGFQVNDARGEAMLERMIESALSS